MARNPFRSLTIVWAVLALLTLLVSRADAATFVVNNTGDAADAAQGNGVCATAGAVCTLRAAIQEANALAGADTITFNIGAGGLQTIAPATTLPTISTEIDVDGTTQPGFAGTPLIKLLGSPAVNGFGLSVTGANSSIRGLIVVAFYQGIQVTADGVVVAGNYIGVTETGAAQGNAGNYGGILVGLAGDYPNTIIGGTTAADRNVISGNSYGIQLLCVSNVRVQGNYIGLDPTGTLARPNTSVPVHVSTYNPGFGYCGASANANVIGGDVAGAGNVVSGNASNGIVIGLRAAGAGTLSGNRVQGNLVGLAADGTTSMPNGPGAGIVVAGAFPGTGSASNTLIGGTTPLARNVLAGSDANINDVGIWVQEGTPTASSPTGTLIQGNYVGLDQSGTLARGFTTGIRVNGIGTVVGGAVAGAGNVVAGNVSHNIWIEPYATTVQGNLIGTNAAGTSAIRPSTFGILVKAPDTVIGGTTPQARNVISGNLNGLVLSGSNQVTVANVTVHGNYIGTDSTGVTAVPNVGSGVVVDAPGLGIGGTGAGMGNVISGNGRGIYLLQTSWGVVSGVSIVGNHIGVNAAGNPLGNSIDGILVDAGVSGASVGGTGTGEANVIAHNASRGVLLLGGTGTVVRGNRIDANGSLGIDIGDTLLVDTNDPLDADTGTNGQQNFPVVSSATLAGGTYAIAGSLASKPNQTYTLDFYANTTCDALNNGEGDAFLGFTQVTTDASGNASFSNLQFPVAGARTIITATATGPEGTSEFSQCRATLTPTVSISGVVTRGTGPGASGLANVAVTLSGAASAATVTNGAGAYTFAALTSGGTYSVTPSLAGYLIAPVSTTLSNMVSDQVANFTATRLYTISGQVRDLNDTGVSGVTMTLGGSSNATQSTDVDGRYSFTVPDGGSYTITPTRGSFVFDPATQAFPNLQEDKIAAFFVAQVGEFTRYFAEGATSGFFDTRIALLNATGRPATVRVRFQKGDGTEVLQTLPMAPIARLTVDPKALGLTDVEFSTVIESDQPIIADRTMSWDRDGYGSHAETSIGRPLTQWYLAEGATIGGFELFYLVQNPNATDATIEVRYLLPAPEAPVVRTYTVTGRSRFNIWVNQQDARLDDAEVSAVVTSTNGVPVIVERAMYLNLPGQVFGAGHESAGVEAPALRWYFAEGATGAFFDLFFLIANPTSQQADVEARYLRPDGTVVVRTYPVPPNSRFNIWVDQEGPALADTAVATVFQVTNNVGVVIERAMWWGGNAGWYEGHNSAGAQATGTKWGLADGEIDDARGAETYVLIGNTSAFAGTARVTLVFEDGTQATRDFPLEANSRMNVAVGIEFPAAVGKRFGTIVDSVGATPAELVVERAMFNDARGVNWAAGSNALGTRLR